MLNLAPNRSRSRSRWPRWPGRTGSRESGSRPPRRQCPRAARSSPHSRPITSTTMIRWCASAVVCSRSIASVAKSTAVSNPKQLVVPTISLSMVLGTPTIGMPTPAEPVRDRQRAVAADDHERVEPHLVEHLDHALGIRPSSPPTSRSATRTGCRVLTVPRMVPPRRRMPVTSRGPSTRERPGSMSPSKLSSSPMHSMCAIVRGLDDRADDGVETGCIAAAGEDPESCDRCHTRDYNRRRVAAAKTRVLH